MNVTRTILQIMPAEGWLAIFTDVVPPYWHTERLAAWALVEDRDEEPTLRYVDGVIASMDGTDLAEEMSNCIGFIHQSEVTDELRQSWERIGSAKQ